MHSTSLIQHASQFMSSKRTYKNTSRRPALTPPNTGTAIQMRSSTVKKCTETVERGGKDVVRDTIITAVETALTNVSGIKLSAEATQRYSAPIAEAQVPSQETTPTSCVNGSSLSFATIFPLDLP